MAKTVYGAREEIVIGARFAELVYGDLEADYRTIAPEGWTVLTDVGSDQLGSGFFSDGSGRFESGGLYSGLVDGGFFDVAEFDAQGLIAEGALQDGERTALVIAFRGTDDFVDAVDDGEAWTPQGLADHFRAFTPLLNAGYEYATRRAIDSVIVAGHSLGGSMVDVFSVFDGGFTGDRDAGDFDAAFDLTALSIASAGLDPDLVDQVALDETFVETETRLLLDTEIVSLTTPGFYLGFDHGEDRVAFPADADGDLTDGLFPNDALIENVRFPDRVALDLPNIENTDIGPSFGAEHNRTLYRENLVAITSSPLLGRMTGNGSHELVLGVGSAFANFGHPGVDDRGLQALFGYAEADFLLGLEGDDEIYGRYGDDLIDGGAGNDTLKGEAGQDTLAGGAGDDVLYGGSGENTAVFSGGRADYLIGRIGDIVLVDGTDADEGVDELREIQWLAFGDGTRERVPGLAPDGGATFELLTPLPAGTQVRVTQAPGGDFSHDGDLYYGWDFVADGESIFGMDVLAVAPGEVAFVLESVPDGDPASRDGEPRDPSLGPPGGLGNVVTLRHEIDGREFYSSYLHLRQGSVGVEVGDAVVGGQVIGEVGNTGHRTGTHLHLNLGLSLGEYTNDAGTDFPDYRIAEGPEKQPSAAVFRFRDSDASDGGLAVGDLATSTTPPHAPRERVETGEFLLNTITAGQQVYPELASLSGDGFVAVWDDIGTSDVRGRLFLEDGSPTSDDFRINSVRDARQWKVDVAPLDGGGFVVVFTDTRVSDGYELGTLAFRIFDPAGNPISDDVVATSGQAGSQRHAHVTALSNGGFAIAWSESMPSRGDGSGFSVVARFFTADGTPLREDQLVNVTTLGDQRDAKLASLGNGNVAIAWTGRSADGGSKLDVFARIFDPDGNPVSGEFLVNQVTGETRLVDVAAAGDEHFIVTFTENLAEFGDGDGASGKARVFRNDGTPRSNEFQTNQNEVYNQFGGIAEHLGGDQILVAWTDQSGVGPDEDGWSARARVFDMDGRPLSDEALVNKTIVGQQFVQDIASLDDGRVAVAWTDSSRVGGDASSFSAKARILDPTTWIQIEGRGPTAWGKDAVAAAQVSTPLTTLFTWMDPDGAADVVSFAVRDRTLGGGRLTRDGVPQAEGVVHDEIPISEIDLWSFVAGEAGDLDVVAFNAIDRAGVFNTPSAVAEVLSVEETSMSRRPSYPGATTQEHQNRHAFAALREDGSVVTWGDDRFGGDSSAVASELGSVGSPRVTEIFSTESAFAALREDGSVVTWGWPDNGGDSGAVAGALDADGSPRVTEIFSTGSAFAALREDGSVVTWGRWGGDSSSVASELDAAGSPRVSEIFSTLGAFAALREDGSIVTWGANPWGNNSSAVASALDAVGSPSVTEIFSNWAAFAALREDGSVVTWGSWGGDSGAVAGALDADGSPRVTGIFATGLAFAALREDGSVVTWGKSDGGGDSAAVAEALDADGSPRVTGIFSTYSAFAALREDGSVVTWGESGRGGDSGAVAGALDADGSPRVTEIFSTKSAFAALREDGSVVTWGDSLYGGDSGAVAGALDADGSPRVTGIFSTSLAFAALRENGSVVTWGHHLGGDSSGVASELDAVDSPRVTKIFANDMAFVALREDGSITTWGHVAAGADSSALADEFSDELSSGVVGIASIYSDMRDNEAASGAPSATGPELQGMAVGGVLSGSDLITVSDPDGFADLARVRFWDATPGTDGGRLHLDGAPVGAGHVDVLPDQLDRVTYVAGPRAGENTIAVNAYDRGGLESPDHFVTIRVSDGSEAPPVAEADFAVAEEDGFVDVDVLANDTDPNGDALRVLSASGAANGVVSVNADGTVRYRPDFGFGGEDGFDYVVSDGDATATGRVTVTVVPEDAPEFARSFFSISGASAEEGGELVFEVRRAGDLSTAGAVTVSLGPPSGAFAASAADHDFAGPVTLTFAAGDPVEEVRVLAIDDSGAPGGDPDDGTTERLTLTLSDPVNGTIGTGAATGLIVDPSDTPPPAGLPDTGPFTLQLTGGDWSEAGDGSWRADGTLVIGRRDGLAAIARIESGAFTLTSSELSLQSGRLVPLLGPYEDAFVAGAMTLSFDDGKITPDAGADRSAGFEIAGLEVDVASLYVRPDKIAILGGFRLPSIFEPTSVSYNGLLPWSHEFITVDQDGVSFDGEASSRVSLFGIEEQAWTDFKSGWIPGVDISELKVSVGEDDTLRLEGLLELEWIDKVFSKDSFDFVPTFYIDAASGDGERGLLGDEQHITIRDGRFEGEVELGLEGLTGKTSSFLGFDLKELKAGIGFSSGVVTDFSFNGLGGVGGVLSGEERNLSIGFGANRPQDGDIFSWRPDDIEIGYEGFALPLGATGIFVDSFSGGIFDFSPGGNPLGISFDAGGSWGRLFNKRLLDLELSADLTDFGLNLPSYDIALGGSASKELFDQLTGTALKKFDPEDLPLLEADTFLSLIGRASGSFRESFTRGDVDLNLLDRAIEGNLNFSYDGNLKKLTFGGGVSANIPEWSIFKTLAGKGLAGAEFKASFSDDGDEDNDGFGIYLSATIVGIGVSGTFIWTDSIVPDAYWGNDLYRIGSWFVPEGEPFVAMTASWTEPSEAARLVVIRPDGTEVAEAEFEALGIEIVEDLTSRYARTVAVPDPEAGVWDVRLEDEAGLGAVDYSAFTLPDAPELEIASVSMDPDGVVSVEFTLSDEDSDTVFVEWFLDDDAGGHDGRPIDLGSTLGEGAHVFEWDTTGSAPGSYHLYAVVTDGPNRPVHVDADDPIEITASADLSLLHRATRSAVRVAETFEHVLVVDNAGESVARNVALQIDGGGNAGLVSASAGVLDAGLLTLGDLAAGERIEVTLTFLADDDPGATRITAAASADDWDPDPLDNVAASTIVVRDAVFVRTGDVDGDDFSIAEYAGNLAGRGGADTLAGGGGDDLLEGEDGDDHLSGGEGRDVLLGGDGADLLEGGASGDDLFGGDEEDRLDGGEGSDRLRPGRGADVISTGPGRDRIAGLPEELDGDRITDFDEADLLLFEGVVFGTEDLTVTPGSAILDVELDGDGASDATVTLEGDYECRRFEVVGYGDATAISLAANAPPAPEDDAAWVREDRRVSGDVLGNDEDPDGDALSVVSVAGDAAGVGVAVRGRLGTLTLNADGSFDYAADRADGLIGGETATDAFVYAVSDGAGGTAAATLTVTVEGADETLKGGRGRDVLKGGGGDDKLIGRGGNDKLKGKGGDDVLKGNGGKDRLIGQRGDDTLKGGGGNDKLNGNGGDDLLQGQGGKDKLKSGGGEDVLRFKRGDGKDVVLDWKDGEDVIHIQKGANGFRQLDIHEQGRHVLVEYGKRGDVIKLKKTDADELDVGDFLF